MTFLVEALKKKFAARQAAYHCSVRVLKRKWQKSSCAKDESSDKASLFQSGLFATATSRTGLQDRLLIEYEY